MQKLCNFHRCFVLSAQQYMNRGGASVTGENLIGSNMRWWWLTGASANQLPTFCLGPLLATEATFKAAFCSGRWNRAVMSTGLWHIIQLIKPLNRRFFVCVLTLLTVPVNYLGLGRVFFIQNTPQTRLFPPLKPSGGWSVWIHADSVCNAAG